MEFENEPDTDFSSMKTAFGSMKPFKDGKAEAMIPSPLSLKEKKYTKKTLRREGVDPAYPNQTLYTYTLADWNEVDLALKCAEKNRSFWSSKSVRRKS